MPADERSRWPPGPPEPAPEPTKRKVLKPPSDLVPKGRGRRFWRSVLGEYDLRSDELELLAEVARQLDLLDRLRADVDDGPLLVNDKLNPLAVELRQVRMEVRRGLAQLNLPDPNGDGAVSDDVSSVRSARARKAARARWDAPGAI